MNARDNYLIAARGGKPERVPVFPIDCNIFMPDFWMMSDENGRDFCGIKWIENDAGRMPDYSKKAMTEISQWREVVHFPDPAKMDWEGMHARYMEMYDPDKVNICMLNTSGLFLIPINMMGWEDTLCAIYEEPEELSAFVNAIADFLLSLIPYMARYFKPDIIFAGDDYSSANGPFISKEVFREIYKPNIVRINKAIHEIGALVEFHNCGNNSFLIREIIDAGVDICQLPEPNAELLADKKELGSRLVLTGGWDRHGPGSMPFASEEAVRKSVRDAVDTYGKDGALIFWDGGIVGSSEDSQNKMKWVMDEILSYGSRCYK